MATPPYAVKHVKHRRGLRSDATVGGEYEVTIQHANGMESSFTVPEGPNAASDAHAAAMNQVDQARQITALPSSAAS